MSILLRIAAAMVVIWIIFRIVWFIRKRVLHRRERRPAGFRCPACGAKDLDDYSDAESGMCFACNHIWGVDAPKPDPRE